MKLALSPHSDDIELFLAFTAMREKPHVIVCLESHLQQKRGTGITQDQRWQETVAASEILGYPLLNLGLSDVTVTQEALEEALSKYTAVNWEVVYAPALQHGNIHHDMVYHAAKKLFGGKVIEYTTYTKSVLWTVGNKEVIPTQEEIELKNKALMCHQSQFEINRPHFDAVFGRNEWLNDPKLPLYQDASK